jgi:hypothetical protein
LRSQRGRVIRIGLTSCANDWGPGLGILKGTGILPVVAEGQDVARAAGEMEERGALPSWGKDRCALQFGRSTGRRGGVPPPMGRMRRMPVPLEMRYRKLRLLMNYWRRDAVPAVRARTALGRTLVEGRRIGRFEGWPGRYAKGWSVAGDGSVFGGLYRFMIAKTRDCTAWPATARFGVGLGVVGRSQTREDPGPAQRHALANGREARSRLDSGQTSVGLCYSPIAIRGFAPCSAVKAAPARGLSKRSTRGASTLEYAGPASSCYMRHSPHRGGVRRISFIGLAGRP